MYSILNPLQLKTTVLSFYFANINVILIVLTYCGSTKCSQPVWGDDSCKQCYVSLFLHIFTGAVGKKKKKQYIPYRDIFKLGVYF